MNPNSLPLLFLLLAVISADATLEETCKNVVAASSNINYDFCVTSLQADPRSSSADAFTLALISVDLSTANATSTDAEIQNLLKNASDGTVKNCLQACATLYQLVVSNLQGSADAIRSKRYVDAEAAISSSISVPTICEQVFKDKGVNSPLTKQNSNLSKLTVIAFVTISALV